MPAHERSTRSVRILLVVGEAGIAGEAVRRAETDHPDLVVIDVRLPDRSRISACHEITSRFPDVKVLILTSYADDVALAAAMTAGASGYVLKSARAVALVEDLRRVMAKERTFDQRGRTREPASLLSPLSPQERALATQLAEGLTNREIAERMGLAEKTVKNYVSSVLTKLGMSRRSEAAAFVARVETLAGSALVDDLTVSTRARAEQT